MGSCQSNEAAVDGGNSPPKTAPRPEQSSGQIGKPKSTAPTSRTAESSAKSVSNGTASTAPVASLTATVPSDVSKDHLESSTHSRGSTHSFDSTHSNSKASTGDLSTSQKLKSSGDAGSVGSSGSRGERRNPKSLGHSSSVVGLDSMIDNRRESNLLSNVVHMEVPFGKPIEEVYDGVHTGPVLGSGVSGIVRLVSHKATGVKYAVKCLDLGLVDTDEGLQQLREEIFIMCQLDHPNIVRLEEVYESHSEIYLVQELCLGGELFDRLDEQPDYHYTEAECARLIKQMLCSVRYLHSKGIIHRDLKLENFIFSSTAPDSELKMIDFGLSKHFRYGEVQHEAVGTPYTVAPEVIRGTYDEKCDIWAIGVISFLLLSGEPPFGGCGGPEPLMTVRGNILKGAYSFEPADIWCLVSKGARNFIKELLVVDPKVRPTAKKVQQHPWLKDWANRTKTEDDNILNPNVVKALVNFKEFSDMRKLLCEVLSFTLLPEQITDLRKEFEKMDTDGSGEISLGALKQVLVANAGAGSLGALTEEEVEDIFNAMRVKKTETRIHWHEFIAAGLSQCQVDDRNLRLAFDRLDNDHKGYVTIDDIMDLLGSDSLHSEEMMLEMWGDSMKAVNCNKSRITYDDFLLLMKGQTAEGPEVVEEQSMLKRLSESSKLHPVPETIGEIREETKTEAPTPLSHGRVPPGLKLLDASSSSLGMPLSPISSAHDEDMMDTPLSMDDDEDLDQDNASSAFRTNRDFTPPSSPKRSAADYVSPLSTRPSNASLQSGSDIGIPDLNMSLSPPVYIKKRSRSVGDDEGAPDSQELKEPESPRLLRGDARDSRRALLLPEHDHNTPIANDQNKSALQVNRKLYRTHRHMRMAVMEASKRFEEEQTRHAREVLTAQQEEEVKTKVVTAGLVMRRGDNKQVSSEAVSTHLENYRTEQEKLVEVANKRGGRGRRHRKKTISDMTQMMGSLSQDDLQTISQEAALEAPLPTVLTPARVIPQHAALTPVIEAKAAEVRGATVPGNFRPVADPFSGCNKF